MSVVMGTAGHVDHGKTTLVRALTGIDCDRLLEEKRRGITIELGFAYCDLPDAGRIGIIDVPGHEKFIRNMVSGASGIDFVMLVVAADEGIMPQTSEHVEICRLLGIQSGFIALTKVDMADDAWRDLVIADIRAALGGTFLEHAPIIPVSAALGTGLDDIRRHMAQLALQVQARKHSELLRLPVDRAFTLKGHGTVVTGTLVSGQIQCGEELILAPGNKPVRVRSLQNHGVSVGTATQGSRVAVNVSDIEVADIFRGDILTRAGSLFPSEKWLARVCCSSASPIPVKHRTEFHFHHLARETEARVYLLDRDFIAPGEAALAEIRFSHPMPGVFGDAFVLRGASPLKTIGGGIVLNPFGSPVRRKDMTSEISDALMNLPDMPDSECTAIQVEFAGLCGTDTAHLAVLTHADASKFKKILPQLTGKRLFCFDRDGGGVISASAVAVLCNQCLERMAAYHKAEPMKIGLSRDAVLDGWGDDLPPKLAHFILMQLIKKGDLASDGEVVRLASHNIALDAEQSARRRALLELYAESGLTPPSLKNALASVDWTDSEKSKSALLKLMIADGELVKLSEDMYCAADAVNELKSEVRSWFDTHSNLDPAALREICGGLSRKYVIAYLEYFDREGFTLRVGDSRRLRKI